MSLTPELRQSPLSMNHYGSGAQQRKTSKLYEAPSYVHSPDGIPVVRVDQADAPPTTETAPSRSRSNSVALAIKMGVAAICLLGWTANVLGPGTVMAASQLLGFMFLFVLSFAGSCGVFLWWASWAKEPVGLSHKKALYAYVALCVSELVASVCDTVIDLGPLERFPIDISHYALLCAAIQVSFTVLVHEKGAASLFAQESSAFMGLSVLLHLGAEGLFGKLLPLVVYSQLVYASCLLALSISLILSKLDHNLSITTMKRMMSMLRRHSRNLLPRTYAGRRVSTTSNASSSAYSGLVFHRGSVTSGSNVSSSIPASYLGGSNSVDLDSLNEAHGVIGDVLLQEASLSQKGKESLKQIHQLLAPRVTRAPRYAARSPLRVDSLSEMEDDTDGRSSIGASPHVYGYKSPVSRQQSKTMSSTRFSTTTTATGLPFMEEDPAERKPSLALREVRTRISLSEREKRMSVHRMSFRDRLGSIPNIATSQQLSASGGSVQTSPSKLGISRHSTSTSDTELERARSSSISDDEGDRQPIATPPLFMRPRAASDTPPSVARPAEAFRRVSESPKRRAGIVRAPSSESVFTIPENSNVNSESSKDNTDKELANTPPDDGFFNKKRHMVMFSPFVKPDMDYTLEEYQNSNTDLFEQAHEWDFPIFDLEKHAKGNILSQMAYKLFHEAGLMETFRIPQREFINYFRILEANYGRSDYHNKTHAADVLHATSYLLFEQIPEFTYAYSHHEERAWRGRHQRASGGNIASAFSVLELFACYMAAAMHDFDHPGRTNAFLVSTGSPLAILYNDRSVLENHHAAASWDLLTNYPEFNLLQNLEASEFKRFRFLLIECILATDLKLHFDILRNFKAKTNPNDGEGIDWTSDVDRLMVMKMIIKMADINTPSKSYDLHRKWTVRITEEFFQQHDDEIRLGLPQTIFMNRHETEKLPAIQVSFIQNLVSPLFQACAEAGIIPGIVETVGQGSTTSLPTESTPNSPEKKRKGKEIDQQSSFDSEKGLDSENEDDDMSDNIFSASSEDDSFDEENMPNEAGEMIPVRKVFSVILTNLQINYEGWRRQLPEEEGSPSKPDSKEPKGKEEEKPDGKAKKEKP